MTARNELEALAAKVGVYYHDGNVHLCAPLYAFTPGELAQFAARLRPARVPEGWREFIEECAKAAGGEVCGNALSRRASALLAAPAPDHSEEVLDMVHGDSLSLHGAAGQSVSRPGRSTHGGESVYQYQIYQYQTVTNGWRDLRDATEADLYRAQGWPVRTLYTHPASEARSASRGQRHAEADPLADENLPGMWERADLIGGETDSRPPIKPAAQPASAGEGVGTKHHGGVCHSGHQHAHECPDACGRAKFAADVQKLRDQGVIA